MMPRGRPQKCRTIRDISRISQFSPRGRAGRPDERELSMDELEAIRLVDHAGMCQKAAAESMNVSQQTFSRILKKARKAIADTLVNGKIIRIQGGNYALNSDQIRSQNGPMIPDK